MSEPPTIPAGYAGEGYTMEWMSNYITPGSYVTCVPAQIVNFNCFYVNSLEHWNTLEDFMSLFHARCRREQDNLECIPDARCLKAGLYVAVKYKTPNSSKGWEYHRALILEPPEANEINKYKVILIDFGDLTYMRIDEIRYIKRDFLDRFPAQAIECRMHLDSVYDIYIELLQWGWEPTLVREFKQKIRNRILGIDFIQAEEANETHSKLWKRWTVSVSIIKKGARDLSEVELMGLEKLVINEVHGEYIRLRGVENR